MNQMNSYIRGWSYTKIAWDAKEPQQGGAKINNEKIKYTNLKELISIRSVKYIDT